VCPCPVAQWKYKWVPDGHVGWEGEEKGWEYEKGGRGEIKDVKGREVREGDGKETRRMGRVGERKGKREEGLELDICAGATSC